MQVQEMATAEGMTFWVRPGDNFRAKINMMDEAGDVFQDTLQAGRKTGDGLAEDIIRGEVVLGIIEVFGRMQIH